MPAAEAMKEVNELMKLIDEAKAGVLTASTVMVIICTRLVHPIKDRVHLLYEVMGPLDPTREDSRNVREPEVCARMTMFTMLPAENMGPSKPYLVFRPPPAVSVVLPFCLALEGV